VNILVIGMRGQGKSTLALYLARKIQLAESAHVIAIFDPKRTFNSVPHTSDVEVFEEWLETHLGAISYQPFARPETEKKSTDEIAEEFTEFFNALGVDWHFGLKERAARQNMAPFVLIVDEAWFLQGGMSAHPKLEQIVRLADSKNFYLIECAHRPKDFATRIRAQVDELYIFHQWLEEDLEIVRSWCGDEVANIVSKLPPHHVVRYEISTRTFQVWTHPEGWHSDISQEYSPSCPATTN
jgi:hypothetical protein